MGLVPVRVDVQNLAELGDRLGVTTGGAVHLRPGEPGLEKPGVELDRAFRRFLRLAE